MTFVTGTQFYVYLSMFTSTFSIVSYNSVLNVKVVAATLNQEKALVRAFSVIANLRFKLYSARDQA